MSDPVGAGANPWQDAVVEALVVDCIYNESHDKDPDKAVRDLCHWEAVMALDPKISSEAKDLVDTGRKGLREEILKQLDQTDLLPPGGFYGLGTIRKAITDMLNRIPASAFEVYSEPLLI